MIRLLENSNLPTHETIKIIEDSLNTKSNQSKITIESEFISDRGSIYDVMITYTKRKKYNEDDDKE